MAPRGLTDNERKVLDAVQHDSRQTVQQIAAKARMRHHTAVYTLKQLRDRGLIRPYLLTNPHALGLTDYCIFFNYVGREKGARKKIIDYCVRSPQVAYFAELSGPFQYSVSLFCRTVFEVTSFFDSLSKHLSRSSFDMSFALRLEFTQFLGKWRDPAAKPRILARTRTTSECTIDEVDRKILAYYSQNAGASLEAVGRIAAVSESTVRNRLANLEKCGVIHSFAYIADMSRIGMSTCRIILAATGPIQPLRLRLFRFMSSHPKASTFVHCIGAWDFELNFDLEDQLDMGEIIESVTDNFGANIRRIHTSSEIRVHRAHHFPLHAGLLA